jgi:hypothetical protein
LNNYGDEKNSRERARHCAVSAILTLAVNAEEELRPSHSWKPGGISDCEGKQEKNLQVIIAFPWEESPEVI